MSELVKIFHGPEEFLPAVQATLTDSDAHLVVVRNLVTPAFAGDMKALTQAENDELFRSEVSNMDEVDALVLAWWAEHGYENYAVKKQLHTSDYRRKGRPSLPHIDRQFGTNFKQFRGAVTLSVGRGGRAYWAARRSDQGLYTDGRQFSLAKGASWETEVCKHRLVNPIDLPARAIQHATDGVLIAQHPYPTAHRVLPMPWRSAAIFDIEVEKIKIP